MPSLYTFTDYSCAWPSAFETEADRLRALLGEELVAAHHIGSTSVPGLAAKPIIDLLPLVRSIAAVDDRTAMLRAAGYRDWGEYGLSGRLYLTRDRGEVRTHNVHIYQSDDPAVERHLAFCAYLRHHEPARREYEALKSGLCTHGTRPTSRRTTTARTRGSSEQSRWPWIGIVCEAASPLVLRPQHCQAIRFRRDQRERRRAR